MLPGKALLSTNFAIATENRLASLAALRAMEKGGNAADAAVTAGLVFGIVRPELSGLGGDFFALYYHAKDDKVHCLNSSGWVSNKLTVDKVRSLGHNRIPSQGGLSVVVPGFLKGIHELHERFGKLDFSGLFEYPISLAQNGFPVTLSLLNAVESEKEILSVPAKKIFRPEGRRLRDGESLKQENLSRTLKAIQSGGPGAFYNGEIAEKISQAVAREGGVLEPEDFGSFEPEWVEPLTMKYRGTLIHEIPPNSMGATALLALKYLEREDLQGMKPNSKERITATVNAAIRAYAKKNQELGDPRFASFDPRKFLEVNSSHVSHPATMTSLDRADTTYYAISDKEGNVLSAIQSHYFHFGSKVFVEDCGIFLNNQASAFAIEGPNKVEPRKRPMHTLSALLLSKDGEKPEMALGTSGGDFRPQQHVLFVTNLLDYSMSLEDAIGYPRFLWIKDREVMIEQGFEDEGLNFDKIQLGYPGKTGVAHGVAISGSGKKAVCDIRGEGVPMGDNSLKETLDVSFS